MNSPIIVLLGLSGLFTWWVSGKIKDHIRQTPSAKPLYRFFAAPAMVVGVLAVFWLPEQIPFNRESPGGLFTVYLPCFALGAALFFGGIGAIWGAVRQDSPE